MRTIAIINQKGGTGKTTTAINLAATLAVKGRRTLLVDMDPQSHCAMGLAVPEAQIDQSVADLLRCGLDGSMALSDIVWQIARNLDLAPSSMALAMIEQQLAGAGDRDRRLAQVLSTAADRYELCIVDCPPSIGLLTFNALRAADEVIIPVETGYFAMQGAVKQQQTIEMLARRAGHHVRFKVLATMYDVRTKLAREILSELKRHFDDLLLPVVINFNSKLKEAASFGQPITEYDPVSRGMQDFEQLADWLLANPPIKSALPPGPDLPAVETPTHNPAMSRAAELVERARALSARTAQLSARLARDPDYVAEAPPNGGSTPAPDPAPAPAAMPSHDLPPRQAPARTPTPAPSTGGGNGRLAATLQHVGVATQQVLANPVTAPATPNASPAGNGDDDLRRRLERLYGVRSTHKGLLFVQPIGAARQLAIAGDFNNWNPSLTPMRRDPNLGVWQAVVPVPEVGRYRYRLVIDGQWKQDPYNGRVETNPFGELNNVVEVTAP